jgi:gamma-glutamylcyclotransferase (GGCT)/AIG2-like uncharacterized protein YtfP
MDRVFVYGTLRRGASQGFRMDQARWIGSGHVRGILYRIDWYPGLVREATGGAVVGDVYEVDDERMRDLDAYEGEEYRRVQVSVEGDASGVAWIWEWLGDVNEQQIIASGDWLAADREG